MIDQIGTQLLGGAVNGPDAAAFENGDGGTALLQYLLGDGFLVDTRAVFRNAFGGGQDVRVADGGVNDVISDYVRGYPLNL